MAGVEGAAVGEFGAIDDLDDGLDAAKARLARVAAIRLDPVDDARRGVEACLDAAVAFLERRLGDEFIGRSRAEILFDFFFKSRLVALQGQQVVGLVGKDLVGDLDLGAHGHHPEPAEGRW